MALDPDQLFGAEIAQALGLTDKAGLDASAKLAAVINAQIRKATVNVVGSVTGVQAGAGTAPVTATGSPT